MGRVGSASKDKQEQEGKEVMDVCVRVCVQSSENIVRDWRVGTTIRRQE